MDCVIKTNVFFLSIGGLKGYNKSKYISLLFYVDRFEIHKIKQLDLFTLSTSNRIKIIKMEHFDLINLVALFFGRHAAARTSASWAKSTSGRKIAKIDLPRPESNKML